MHSPSSQKSIVHLKEKKDERYVIESGYSKESTIEMVKHDEFVLKSPERDIERSMKEREVSFHSYNDAHFNYSRIILL